MTFSEEKPFTEYIDITFIIKLATTEKGEKENSRTVKRAQLRRAVKSFIPGSHVPSYSKACKKLILTRFFFLFMNVNKYNSNEDKEVLSI